MMNEMEPLIDYDEGPEDDIGDGPIISITGPLGAKVDERITVADGQFGEEVTIDLSGFRAAPEALTEDERAYAKRTFDRAHAAAEVARKATRALEDANAAVLSYRDFLWEKYGLGEADSFDAETGVITRA